MEYYFYRLNVKRRGATNIDLYRLDLTDKPALYFIVNLKVNYSKAPDINIVKVLVSQWIGLDINAFELSSFI